MREREGRRLPIDSEAKRVEADLVRFQCEKLPSGLYRHSAAKFIFEVGRRRPARAGR
jgi:hypothetical protein